MDSFFGFVCIGKSKIVMMKTKFKGFMIIFYISHRFSWVIDLQAYREIRVMFFVVIVVFNTWRYKITISWNHEIFKAVFTQV